MLKFRLVQAFTLPIAITASLVVSDIATARPRDDLITLYLSSDRILAMMRSAGRPPAPVVFDTGTTSNAIDTPYARLLKLPRTGPGDVVDGATGKRLPNTFATTIPDVSLGDVPIGDQKADVYDRHEADAAGIVGPNAFLGRLVYLDLAHSRLRLLDKTPSVTPAGTGQPYLDTGNDDTLPAIEVEMPGLKTLAMLDTGANTALSLPLALAKQLPLEGEPVVSGMAISVSGSRPVYSARIKGSVRIGTVTLENPTVSFSEDAGANVGMPIIRQLSLVLDPAARRSWVVGPVTLTPEELQTYVGRYDVRTVRLEGGRLIYQRDGRDPRPMTPLGGDLFQLDVGDQVQFVREGGRVTALDVIDTQVSSTPRTSG